MWTLSMLLLLLLCEIGVSNTSTTHSELLLLFFFLSLYSMNSVVWCGACAMCIFSTAKRGRWMEWNETGMVVMHFFFGKCSNYINVFHGNSGVNSARIFVYFSFSCWLCLTVICSVLRTFKSLCEVKCVALRYSINDVEWIGRGRVTRKNIWSVKNMFQILYRNAKSTASAVRHTPARYYFVFDFQVLQIDFIIILRWIHIAIFALCVFCEFFIWTACAFNWFHNHNNIHNNICWCCCFAEAKSSEI